MFELFDRVLIVDNGVKGDVIEILNNPPGYMIEGDDKEIYCRPEHLITKVEE